MVRQKHIRCRPNTELAHQQCRKRLSHRRRLRSWENGHFLNSRSVLDDGLWEAQVHLIAEILRENPPIQQYWPDDRHVYSERFNVFVDGILDD